MLRASNSPRRSRNCYHGHNRTESSPMGTPSILLHCSTPPRTFSSALSCNFPTLTTMGDKAFAALIKSCLIRTNDGHFLFCFFQEFAVDPSTPNSYFHIHDSVNYPSLSRRRAGDVRSQVSKLPSSLLCLAVYFSVALATIHLLNFIPRGYC